MNNFSVIKDGKVVASHEKNGANVEYTVMAINGVVILEPLLDTKSCLLPMLISSTNEIFSKLRHLWNALSLTALIEPGIIKLFIVSRP